MLWARVVKGKPGGIAVDQEGSVFVGGYFSDQVTIGGKALASSGGYDIFLEKYDAGGTPLWVRQAGGSGNDVCTSIAADHAGGAYLTGSFTDHADFGALRLVIGQGNQGIFVAHYDRDGNSLWAQRAGPPLLLAYDWDVGTGLSVDAIGDVYVTGYFQGDAFFGSALLRTTDRPSGYGLDPFEIFIAKVPAPAQSDCRLSISLDGATGIPLVRVAGQSGRNYSIQTSTNLTLWTPFATLFNTNGTLELNDPGAKNSSLKFYRAVQLP